MSETSSKLTSKGQTTVPKEVREALGLKPGDQISWEVRGGTATISSTKRHPFFDLEGIIKTGPANVVEAVREARKRRGRI